MLPQIRFGSNYIAIVRGFASGHAGVDLGWHGAHGGQNTPIYAGWSGKVISVTEGRGNNKNNSSDGGNHVVIDHGTFNGQNIRTGHYHMLKGSIKVKVGDNVDFKQYIGNKDDSGYSFGSHDHYVVWVNGTKVDPLKYTYVYPDQVVGSTTAQTWKGKLQYYCDEPKPEPDKFVLTRILELKNPRMKGNDVKQLQKDLIDKGFSVGKFGADGDFGKDTESGVKAFQKANNLLVDGRFGERSAKAMGYIWKK